MPFGWRAVSGGQKQSHWKTRSSTVSLLDRIFQRHKRRSQRKSRHAAFMWSMARELTSGSARSVPRSDIHRPSIAKLSLPERMTPPHPGQQHQLSHREAHRSQYTFQDSARCQGVPGTHSAYPTTHCVDLQCRHKKCKVRLPFVQFSRTCPTMHSDAARCKNIPSSVMFIDVARQSPSNRSSELRGNPFDGLPVHQREPERGRGETLRSDP